MKTNTFEERFYLHNMQTTFVLTAVPSHFVDWYGSRYHIYQLTSNYLTNKQAPWNTLVFQYELSPIAVQYTQSRESIAIFLTRLCAIIGGVFTVAGIVDAIMHKSIGMLVKDRIGKLI
jgi:Endoplasmic reticulum vesicle transporter